MSVEGTIGKDLASWVRTRVSQSADRAAEQAARSGAIAPDAMTISAAARDAQLTSAVFEHPELADPALVRPQGPLPKATAPTPAKGQAIGGKPLVDTLPAVEPKKAKLGEFAVFDNNLWRSGRRMRLRAERVAPKVKDVGFVAQTTDPVDQATIREIDDQGRLPYQKLGAVSNSDPATLAQFVQHDLYGATGGETAGPHDLILADHGGGIYGWGWNSKDQFMPWPATMEAIAKGLPAGQKLRSLILDMCMTGGSGEAAVEAADKRVAETMIGWEDISYGGLRQDKLLEALQAKPTMSGNELLDAMRRSTKPPEVNSLGYALTGVSLDPAKVQAYTGAFKKLSDILTAKGNADPAFRARLRQAFAKAEPLYNERTLKNEDGGNRDVKALMHLMRGTLKDPEVAAATREVDRAHDALLLTHTENAVEGRMARGLSVNAPSGPMAFDGHMHLKDRGWPGNDYYQTAFNRQTGWAGVLELVNRDHLDYDQACELVATQPQQAIALLRSALQENPANMPAKTLLGQTLLKDPQTFDAGVQTLSQVANTYVNGDLRAANIHRDLGLAYLAKGDKANAKAQLTQFANGVDAYTQGAQQWMTYAKYQQMQTWMQQQYGPALAALKGL